MIDYMCPADPTITHCYHAAKVNELIAERDAEIARLRAALKECLGWHDYADDMYKPIEVRAAYMRARAALTAQPAAPGGDA